MACTRDENPTEAASFGALVELEGRTAPGAFAPIVVYSTLRVLGKAPLPPPLPVSELEHGLSARTENAWTVVKGVLRPRGETVAVATRDGELPLYLFIGDARSLQPLVDAEVEVSGVFAVIHRARRIVGYRLLVQSPAQVAMTGPAADAGSRPVWPIAQLFAYWPTGRPLHRLSIEEVFGGEHDGRLLRVSGRLRERTRTMGREWLLLESQQHAVSAVLELPVPTESFEQLRVDSELRVTGIGDMAWDRSRVPPRVKAVRLLLRSPADMEVLRAASWWTRGRIFGLLAAVLALASVTLVWSVALRRSWAGRPG